MKLTLDKTVFAAYFFKSIFSISINGPPGSEIKDAVPSRMSLNNKKEKKRNFVFINM